MGYILADNCFCGLESRYQEERFVIWRWFLRIIEFLQLSDKMNQHRIAGRQSKSEQRGNEQVYMKVEFLIAGDGGRWANS